MSLFSLCLSLLLSRTSRWRGDTGIRVYGPAQSQPARAHGLAQEETRAATRVYGYTTLIPSLAACAGTQVYALYDHRVEISSVQCFPAPNALGIPRERFGWGRRRGGKIELETRYGTAVPDAYARRRLLSWCQLISVQTGRCFRCELLRL